jgi:hypothetical protein
MDNKPNISNVILVLPALLLIGFGCICAGTDGYALPGVIVISVGLLIIAWAMLTGRLKLFG